MIKGEVPYKPNEVVYFAHEQGVKKGVVLSVTMQLNTKGEFAQWQILELQQGETEAQRVVHNVPLIHIASTWEGVGDIAEAKIYSYRQAQAPQKDPDDVFEN